MESIPKNKQEEIKAMQPNTNEVSHGLATEAMKERKEVEKESERVEKIEKVRKGLLARMIEKGQKVITGEVSKEEAMEIIQNHSAKRKALEDIKRDFPERADKYVEFISKFPETNEGVKWFNGKFVHQSDNTSGKWWERFAAGTGSQTKGK